MSQTLRLIKKAISDSPHTYTKVAAHLGISPGILRNKLDAFTYSNLLSLQDFEGILDFVGDMEPLRDLARCFGYDLIERNVTPGQCVVTQAIATSAELGSLMQAVQEAIEDGSISLDELKRIQAAAQILTDRTGILVATAEQQAKSNVTSLERTTS